MQARSIGRLIVTRAALRRLAWLLGIVGVLVTVAWYFLLRMPGESFAGTPPPPDAALAKSLRRDVEHLARESRHVGKPGSLEAAASWIEGQLRDAGYAPARQTYTVRGVACSNIEAEIEGDDEIVIVGAHYDGVPGCPAANDNASGVAATLALARAFNGRRTERALRFVFFVNEEPPWFQTDDMGSLRYARRCRERDETIVAMLSLETLGYFTDEPDTQEYPIPALRAAYGDRGNYVGFVSNIESRDLLHDVVRYFRAQAQIPSQGATMFAAVPGVGWSDHWSFWQCGYPAVMVTDTAKFRYPHYHKPTDTPDKLDYDGLSRVVEGLLPVVERLTRTR
jgi:Zn-dependent M28 family amino/carboxypeptidase